MGHPSKEKQTNEQGLILPNPSQAILGTPWYTAGHFRKDAINTGQLAPEFSIGLYIFLFSMEEYFVPEVDEHTFPNR